MDKLFVLFYVLTFSKNIIGEQLFNRMIDLLYEKNLLLKILSLL